jgi:hypothetical protein
MNAWQFLRELNSICHFTSRERSGRATNSELKRWCQNQAVSINGKRVKFDEEITFPITEMFIFPKNRVTLF